MKQTFTLLILSLFIGGNLSAQSHNLQGKVMGTANESLAGAYVFLLYPWGEQVDATTTQESGTFNFDNIEQGGYKLKITHLGFKDFYQELTLNQDIHLGNIQLTEAPQYLLEVEVKDKLPLAQQLGDTTQYNADAFKTLPDANAEQLLEKMPGVVVDNGKVQAQGEDVKQVLVDGRPFFGNDPTAALRNLPAEVIAKVQVYDQQSEQAQFTGFQDGETTKTINIITRPETRNGQFGKTYAGYGYEDKYQVGGHTSFFDGDRRTSIIGQSNNINIQNFATDDLLGITSSSRRGRGRGGRGGRGGGGDRRGASGDFLVNAQNGIATTHALGLNFSDKFNKSINFSGSYFFNRTEADEKEQLLRTFLRTAGETSETYQEVNTAESNNINHRLNMRWDIDLDSMSKLTVRPRLSVQLNDGSSNTFGQTHFGNTLLNQTDNTYSPDLRGIDFFNAIIYRRKLGKPGRTISLDARTEYGGNRGDRQLYATDLIYENALLEDTLDQLTDLETSDWELSGRLSYTEPLGERTQFSVDYRSSWQEEESDLETFDFVDSEGSYGALNESLSSVFTNQYTTQQAGAGVRYRVGRNVHFMVRAFAQWATLKSDEEFPGMTQLRRDYFSVLPMAMFRYRLSRQKQLRVFYRSRTQSPSVSQLQNVVDNSNPVQLSVGNPGLDQSLQHRLFIRYNNTNTDKSTVFYFMAGGSYTQNYIANSTYLSENEDPIFNELDLPKGVQLTQPINLDGYWSVNGFTSYGIPIKVLKLNLNIDLNGDFSRTPGLLNGELNYTHNHTLGTGLTLSSNISDRVDFTVSSRSSYNNYNSTLPNASNSSYWNQTSKLRLGWILPAGIVLRSEVVHQYYDGLGEDFNDDYLLWTAGIGKKLFKNERGEITLSVFDVLNQNRRVSRNITDVYIEDFETNVLQRYALLKFTYHFLNYNSGKATSKPDQDRERRPRW